MNVTCIIYQKTFVESQSLLGKVDKKIPLLIICLDMAILHVQSLDNVVHYCITPD